MDAQQNDAAAVRVFPPGVPLAVIILGVALEWLVPIDVGFGLPPAWRYAVGAAIVAGAILGLGLWSVALFRRSGQDENPWKPSPVLVERGPFRISRNPMYVQMMLVCVGFAVLLANVWILLLTPVGAWVIQRLAILPEEAYLERKFGDDYRAYKRRVRRWI
jgi:protein-S-isoprenylcysteine O-methyltransferase Ste14